MSNFLMIVGFAIFIIGGIKFLIAAFRTSLIWGLGCLVIAPVQIIYLVVHWDSAKSPFLIQLLGGFVLFISAYLQGQINI